MSTPQVALLSGCASGVGLHLCGAFLQRGWRVVATDLDFELLSAKAVELGWDPDRVELQRLDVRQIEDWSTAAARAQERFGSVDVLCNAAAVLHPGPVLDTEPADVQRHIAVNLEGLINGSLIVGRQMKAQGHGHIVNIASLAGIAAVPGLALYSATKFGVRGFSLALAQELDGSGVAVTVLCPDAIETPMLQLQEHCPDAALTFSGRRILKVEDIQKVLFDRILPERPMEVAIPAFRSLQARIAGMFPRAGQLMAARLRRRGLAIQRRRLKRQN